MSKQIRFIVPILLIACFLLLFISYVISKKIDNKIDQPQNTLGNPSKSINAEITPKSELSKKIKKGTLNEAVDTVYYQFPFTVLSELTYKDGIYQMKVLPFDDTNQEAVLLLGSEDGNIVYGSCMFDMKGSITSDVTWTTYPIKEISKKFIVGKRYLTRVWLPVTPTTDQTRYKEVILKQIDLIEKGENADLVTAQIFCHDF